MGKEIERKFTVKPTLKPEEILDILRGHVWDKDIIRDYYFNEFTRLRLKNEEAFITIKSKGSLVRDEFEFPIRKCDLDFIPAPLMIKKRYYIPYKGHTFEFNIFENLLDKNGRNIMIVEVELNSEDEDIELPDWIDHDVTNHPSFYGYNLFKFFEKALNDQK